jgi:hypothetical protein
MDLIKHFYGVTLALKQVLTVEILKASKLFLQLTDMNFLKVEIDFHAHSLHKDLEVGNGVAC